MIIDCPAKCGKKVVARADGKAYLCRSCWRRIFATLFDVIRSGREAGFNPDPSQDHREKHPKNYPR